MRIVHIRRISQVFFLGLFGWFCVVASVGERWWQLRGWPVNWFLQLDPLVALGTMLSTRTLYAGLIWALATVVLTLLLGRFFCGWVCPFGTIHQAVGWWGRRRLKAVQKIGANTFRRAHAAKYGILAFLLAAAGWGAIGSDASLQTGLLDPIPFMHRSVNLLIVSMAEGRAVEGAWLLGLVFAGALLLNLVVPRFYCRILCPLGALFGLLSRWSLWRIGKTGPTCTNCRVCAKDCEGACDPIGVIRTPECLVCGNCLVDCKDGALGYHTAPPHGGVILETGLSRRQFLLAAGAGLALPSVARLDRALGANWNPGLIRPPGALSEARFLERCIKCGQCMRVCPTNIIQPALLQAGVEGLWTPVLNYRVGTSGCEVNCVACGNVCPTAALRPLSIKEKRGLDQFAEAGPVRMGLAFVDRGRCLPWAMGRPCIVCQEVCPVAPKAVRARESFQAVEGLAWAVRSVEGSTLELAGAALVPGALAGGDFFAGAEDAAAPRWRVTANGAETITADADAEALAGAGRISVFIRLQLPSVDPDACTGCGICENACPVHGLRAIRVTADNESRTNNHRMTLKETT